MNTFLSMEKVSIFLGFVQGLTEFLPVSSSGHLVIAPYLFQFEDPGLAFDVALHLGTLAAVLGFFWRDWLNLLSQAKDLMTGSKKASYKDSPKLLFLILGTIPAAVFGLLFEKWAEYYFRHPIVVAINLSFFAYLLLKQDQKNHTRTDLSTITAKEAFFIGLAQALAIIPGVSRSGITITAALALGFKRQEAARFSFLLSAPIIAGAGILKAKTIITAIKAGGPLANSIGLGFFSSFASGLCAIFLLTSILKSRTLKPFVYYRWALSALIIIIVLIR